MIDEIVRLFRCMDVKDAVEQILEDGISLRGKEALDEIWVMVFDETYKMYSPDVLHCLGHITIEDKSWKTAMIERALKSANIEVRDAAICVAELWGGEEMINILKNHNESVTWLRGYLEKVVEDLEREL